MAGLTLADAQARLAAWLAADDAVSKGQSYNLAGRSLTRVNAREIQNNIEFWDRKVQTLTRGRGVRMRSGVPE